MDYNDFRFNRKHICKTTDTVYYSCSALLIVKGGLVIEKNEHSCVSTLPTQVVNVRAEMRNRLHTLAIEQPILSDSALWETVRNEVQEQYRDQPLKVVPNAAGVVAVRNASARIYGFDVFRAVETDATRRLSESDGSFSSSTCPR